jgi:O-antigen biosynthesis protein
MTNIIMTAVTKEMSPRRIFFHSGAGKTGSSALQAYFYANKEAFKNAGISYENNEEFTRPDQITSGNGMLLHSSACSSTVSADELDAVINSYFYGTQEAICSSEYLSWLTINNWQKIKASCSRLDITPKIVSFIRDIEAFYTSEYHQSVKRSGEGRSFEEFFADSPTIYNHLQHIKDIADVFGQKNICVLHYETVKKYLDKAFFKAIGRSCEFFDRTILNQTVNRSLVAHELELLKKINRATGGSFSTEISDLLIYARPSLIEASEKYPDIFPIMIQRHAKDVAWANRTFFDDENTLKITSNDFKNSITTSISKDEILAIEDDILSWSLQKIVTLQGHRSARLAENTAALVQAFFDQQEDLLKENFDSDFYLKEYPDVALANLDPIRHYQEFGIREGRLPTKNLAKILPTLLKKREASLRSKLEDSLIESENRIADWASREANFTQQLIEIKLHHQAQLANQRLQQMESEDTLALQVLESTQKIQQHAEHEQLLEQELANVRQEAKSARTTYQNLAQEQVRKHADQQQALELALREAHSNLTTQLKVMADRESKFTARVIQLVGEKDNQAAARETTHSENFMLLHTMHAKQISSYLNANASSEQAFFMQLKEKELRNSTLNEELNEMRSTLSWRWTTPMRSLARILGLKNKSRAKNLYASPINQLAADEQHKEPMENNIDAPVISHEPSSNVDYRISDMTLTHNKKVTMSVDELLSYNDELFIRNAYGSILGRAPDPIGLSYYLNRLNMGISKIEILSQISTSTEAKSRPVKLVGLSKAIQEYKWLKTPVLGSILRLIKRRESDIETQRSLRVVNKKLDTLGVKVRDELAQVNRTLTQLLGIEVSLLNQKNETNDEVSKPQTAESLVDNHTNEITRAEFDADWYLSQYPDIAKARLDPYDHYTNTGKSERRLALRRGAGFPQIQSINDKGLEELSRTIESWPRKPLISIIMATYNTPENWLTQALDSVINQVYTNWELCIADDSSTHPHVKNLLDKYRKKDPRIKVEYRIVNARVSAALNTALALVTGEFTVLFDHDDLLEPHALYHVAKSITEDFPDIIYSDEIIVSEDASEVLGHAFRPMFSLELLRSHPYIVHLVAFRSNLLKAIGGFDETLNISQDYDLILRAVELAKHIVHIPHVLYKWRTHKTSSGHTEKNNVMGISKKILNAHLVRCGENAEVVNGKSFNFFEVRYALEQNLHVAIVIPTKNHGDLVRQCINSIKRTVSRVTYDIVLIDHASDDKSSIRYFDGLSKIHTVLRYEGEFNFSAINNWAIKQLSQKYSHFLFCNNDIEALEVGWLDRMLELGQKSDVGIVGAKLYYPGSDVIQHAGVCVGMFGAAEHYGKFMDKNLPDGSGIHPGYIGSLITNHEMSSVTAACMLIKRNAFDDVGGFDEDAKVGFGDVDLCLRVRQLGYRVIFCANAELIHHESLSRGKSTSDPHPEDSAYFLNRWQSFITEGDPYYSPNLTLFNTHWNLKRSEEFQFEKEKKKTYRSFLKLCK